ncbi:MAG: glycosyltransferase [Thermosulfidibacteraceae bacterium]|jgi:glycosyltransferase involved in cell wall biosynthesis
MRVLHLGKLCPPNEGGIEVFTSDLLECLNLKSIEADLLCFGDKMEEGMYNGFKFYSCKIDLKLSSALVSLDFVKHFKKLANKYDLIHVHSPNPIAEMLSIFSPRPFVVHWHSDIVRQRILYTFYKPFQQAYLKRAKRIICTSPQYLESSNQVASYKEKAVVIPLGLNPRRLSCDENDEKFVEMKDKIKGKRVVLSIGRLIYYKGFEYLIESAKFLPDDVVVVIAGGGPLYAKLNNLIEKWNLKEKVLLAGKVKDVGIFMKNCDVFCLPSTERSEAFGLVLVEAFYYGKPLITTNVYGSGMSYVNRDGETGFVIPPRDPRAIAEAVMKVLSDKELYDRFSRNALDRVKEFDINSVVDRIIDVYNQVLEG